VLVDALRAVGELLAAEGERIGIAVVGGAAMVLGKHAARLTEDVEIIALGRGWNRGTPAGITSPDPLPVALLQAASRVARDFNLLDDWMNSTVGAQWKTGLPRGFGKRLKWLRYGGLFVGVADRRDLIFLKLYAAVDSDGPQSVHYQDLLVLNPTKSELRAAVGWVRSQDPSPAFAEILVKVKRHVRRDQEEPD